MYNMCNLPHIIYIIYHVQNIYPIYPTQPAHLIQHTASTLHNMATQSHIQQQVRAQLAGLEIASDFFNSL
jgi:hypothetical protein